jgi:hypothetical protein
VNTPKKNNKALILLFVAAFVLPVILAKLALDNGWFNQAATNKGELITPPLDMRLLNQTDAEPKWKLLYVLPQVCAAECENALYSIAQVHSALGKHADRAEALVIANPMSDPSQVTKLTQQKQIRLVTVEAKVLQQVFNQTSTDGIFIADTLDNVILRYPLQNNKEQAVQHSRDILADMRKVLKLSRIG